MAQEINLPVKLLIENLLSILKQMRSELGTLKVDSSAYKKLSGVILDIEKRILSLLVSASRPMVDVKQFTDMEKEVSRIEDDFTKLLIEAGKIKFSDLSLNSALKQELEEFNLKIKEITDSLKTAKENAKNIFLESDIGKLWEKGHQEASALSFSLLTKAISDEVIKQKALLQEAEKAQEDYLKKVSAYNLLKSFIKNGGGLLNNANMAEEIRNKIFNKNGDFTSKGRSILKDWLIEQFSLDPEFVNSLIQNTGKNVSKAFSDATSSVSKELELSMNRMGAEVGTTKKELKARGATYSEAITALSANVLTATLYLLGLKDASLEANKAILEQTKTLEEQQEEFALWKRDLVEGAQAVRGIGQAAELARAPIQLLNGAFGEGKDKLNSFHEAANKLSGISNFINRYIGIYAIMRKVILGIRSAINNIKELDLNITNIAVVTNMSQQDLWGKIGEYTLMAQQYGVATKDVYTVSQLFYQQGLQTNQVMSLTTETLKMAKIAGMEFSDAANAMTVAIRAFNIDMQEALQVTDTYSALAAKFAVSSAEIANAMEKTASSAANVGMSLLSTSAFISVMEQTTREGAQNIGSALKSIISRYGEMKASPDTLLNVDGEEVAFNKVDTALKSVGISIKDASGQFRNFDDVIMELALKWNTLDNNTQRYIATVMAGNRQQSRFIALVSNYDELSRAINTANNAENASIIQVGKTMDSLETKALLLKNAFAQLYLDLHLEEGLKSVYGWLTNIVKTIGKLGTLRGVGMTLANVIGFGTGAKGLVNLAKEKITTWKVNADLPKKIIEEVRTEASKPIETEWKINTDKIKSDLESTASFASTSLEAHLYQSYGGPYSDGSKEKVDEKMALIRSKYLSGELTNMSEEDRKKFINDELGILKKGQANVIDQLIDKFIEAQRAIETFNESLKNATLAEQDNTKETEGNTQAEIEGSDSKEKDTNSTDVHKLSVEDDKLALEEHAGKVKSSGEGSWLSNHSLGLTTGLRIGSSLLRMGGTVVMAAGAARNDTSEELINLGKEYSKLYTGIGNAMSGAGTGISLGLMAGGPLAAAAGGLIGALVGGIGAITDALDVTTAEMVEKLKEEAQVASDNSLKKLAEVLDLSSSIDNLKALKKVIYNSTEDMQAYKDAMNTMADLYPNLISSYDEAGNAIIDINDAEASLAEIRLLGANAARQAAITEGNLYEGYAKGLREAYDAAEKTKAEVSTSNYLGSDKASWDNARAFTLTMDDGTSRQFGYSYTHMESDNGRNTATLTEYQYATAIATAANKLLNKEFTSGNDVSQLSYDELLTVVSALINNPSIGKYPTTYDMFGNASYNTIPKEVWENYLRYYFDEAPITSYTYSDLKALDELIERYSNLFGGKKNARQLIEIYDLSAILDEDLMKRIRAIIDNTIQKTDLALNLMRKNTSYAINSSELLNGALMSTNLSTTDITRILSNGIYSRLFSEMMGNYTTKNTDYTDVLAWYNDKQSEFEREANAQASAFIEWYNSLTTVLKNVLESLDFTEYKNVDELLADAGIHLDKKPEIYNSFISQFYESNEVNRNRILETFYSTDEDGSSVFNMKHFNGLYSIDLNNSISSIVNNFLDLYKDGEHIGVKIISKYADFFTTLLVAINDLAESGYSELASKRLNTLTKLSNTLSDIEDNKVLNDLFSIITSIDFSSYLSITAALEAIKNYGKNNKKLDIVTPLLEQLGLAEQSLVFNVNTLAQELTTKVTNAAEEIDSILSINRTGLTLDKAIEAFTKLSAVFSEIDSFDDVFTYDAALGKYIYTTDGLLKAIKAKETELVTSAEQLSETAKIYTELLAPWARNTKDITRSDKHDLIAKNISHLNNWHDLTDKKYMDRLYTDRALFEELTISEYGLNAADAGVKAVLDEMEKAGLGFTPREFRRRYLEAHTDGLFNSADEIMNSIKTYNPSDKLLPYYLEIAKDFMDIANDDANYGLKTWDNYISYIEEVANSNFENAEAALKLLTEYQNNKKNQYFQAIDWGALASNTDFSGINLFYLKLLAQELGVSADATYTEILEEYLKTILDETLRELTRIKINESITLQKVSLYLTAISEVLNYSANKTLSLATKALFGKAALSEKMIANSANATILSAITFLNLLAELIGKEGGITLELYNLSAKSILDKTLFNKGGNQKTLLDFASGTIDSNALESLANAFGLKLDDLVNEATGQITDGLNSVLVLDQLTGTYKILGTFEDFVLALQNKFNIIIDKTSQTYLDALKTFNENSIKESTKIQDELVSEINNVTKGKVGDKINLAYFKNSINDNLIEEFSKLGADLTKDGILTLGSNANIPKITSKLADIAAAAGMLVAELEDTLLSTIQLITALLKSGISGTLSSQNKSDLTAWAKANGIDDLVFTLTADGFKLAEKSAIELYDKLKEIDSLLAKLVFDELNKSLAESNEHYKTIADILARIVQLEKIAPDARTKEYELELLLAKEIYKIRSITDEDDSFNFMSADIPGALKNPLNYWKNVSTMWSTIQDSITSTTDKGLMDAEDFYRIMTQFGSMAEASGTPIAVGAGEFVRNAEDAAKLIEKGYSALSVAADGTAKIDLSKAGIDFKASADDMGDGIDSGIKAIARSQIKMIDAAIAMLEAVDAMQSISTEIDKNHDKLIKFDEIFDVEGDGQVTKEVLGLINLLTSTFSISINGEPLASKLFSLLLPSLLEDFFTLLNSIITNPNIKPEELPGQLLKLIESFFKDEKVEVGEGALLKLEINSDTYKDGLYKKIRDAIKEGRTLDQAKKNGIIAAIKLQNVALGTILENLLLQDSTIPLTDALKISAAISETGVIFLNDDKSYSVNYPGFTGEKSYETIEDAQNALIEYLKTTPLILDEEVPVRGTSITLKNGVKVNGLINAFTGTVTYTSDDGISYVAKNPIQGRVGAKLFFEAHAPLSISEIEGVDSTTTITSNALVNRKIIYDSNTDTWYIGEESVATGLNHTVLELIDAWNSKLNNLENTTIPEGTLAPEDSLHETIQKTITIDNTEYTINYDKDKNTYSIEGTDWSTDSALSYELAIGLYLADPNNVLNFNENDELYGIIQKTINVDNTEYTIIYDKDKNTYSIGDWSTDSASSYLLAIGLYLADPNNAQDQSSNQAEGQGNGQDDGKHIILLKTITIDGTNYTIKVDDKGRVFLNDVEITDSTLKDKLISYAQSDGKLDDIVIGEIKLIVKVHTEYLTDESEDNSGFLTKLTNWVRKAKEMAQTKIESEKAKEETKEFNEQLEKTDNMEVEISVNDELIQAANKGIELVTENAEELSSKTYTVRIVEELYKKNILHGGTGGNWQTNNKSNKNLPNYINATGNIGLAKAQGTLMGELGPELVVSNGRYFVVGKNGPEMVNLSKDAIVFNHLQTKSLLEKGMSSGRGQAVTNERNAVSYATGNVHGGPAMDIGSTIETLRQLRAQWESILNLSVKDLATKAGGGGGGGGSNTVRNSYIKEVERWYNLLQKIAQLEKEITLLEQERTTIASRMNKRDGYQYFDSLKKSLDALTQEIASYKELLRSQKEYFDQRRLELNSSAFSSFYTFDENGQLKYNDDNNAFAKLADLMSVDDKGMPKYSSKEQYDLILEYGRLYGVDFTEYMKYDSSGKEIAPSSAKGSKGTDEDTQFYTSSVLAFFDVIDSLKKEMQSLHDSIAEYAKKQLELEKKQNEILQAIEDNLIDVESKVMAALEDAAKREIDEMKNAKDALQESNEALINGLTDQLNRERNMYQNSENETSLEAKRRQLAILQRSGGSASEISSLLAEIDSEAKDLYFDKLQEQIDSIKEASDNLIEKLERQIKLAEETLEYEKEHGLLWDKVYEIMTNLTPEEITDYITTNNSEFWSKSATDFGKENRDLLFKAEQWKGFLKQNVSIEEYAALIAENVANLADAEKLNTEELKALAEANANALGEANAATATSATKTSKSNANEKKNTYEYTFIDSKGYSTTRLVKANTTEGAAKIADYEAKKLGGRREGGIREANSTKKKKNEDKLLSADSGAIIDKDQIALVHAKEGVLTPEQTSVLRNEILGSNRNSLMNLLLDFREAYSGLSDSVYGSVNNNDSSVVILHAEVNMHVDLLANGYDSSKAADDVMREMLNIARKTNAQNRIGR